MAEAEIGVGIRSASPAPSAGVAIDEDALQRAVEAIRPALQADGGDMEVIGVSADGVVTVSLSGACGTCPISTQTLKAGVERILKDRVPGVTQVKQVA